MGWSVHCSEGKTKDTRNFINQQKGRLHDINFSYATRLQVKINLKNPGVDAVNFRESCNCVRTLAEAVKSAYKNKPNRKRLIRCAFQLRKNVNWSAHDETETDYPHLEITDAYLDKFALLFEKLVDFLEAEFEGYYSDELDDDMISQYSSVSNVSTLLLPSGEPRVFQLPVNTEHEPSLMAPKNNGLSFFFQKPLPYNAEFCEVIAGESVVSTWVEKFAPKEEIVVASTTPAPTKSPSKPTTPKMCKFYLRGKCHFGSKCWNVHDKNKLNQRKKKANE